MTSSSADSAALRVSRRIMSVALMGPLTIIILAALILAAQVTMENTRFAQSTQQILTFVSVAHNFAVRQPDFAMQPGQDLLGALSHAGQIAALEDANAPAKLVNPWQGALHGTVAAPSVLKIDTAVPARDCRRLALFFLREAADLGLAGIEVQADKGAFSSIYKDSDAVPPPAPSAVEAACGQKADTVLALSFRLR